MSVAHYAMRYWMDEIVKSYTREENRFDLLLLHFKKSTKASSRRRRLSSINMEMIRNKCNVKVAWENTENVMSIAELKKRPLTMQLRELAQRARKTAFSGSESPLYAATCPYFYIARVFGLGPYEFADELLAPSNVYMIPTVIWLCLYTYFMYFILLNFTFASSEDREILRLTEISKTIFNYGVAIFDLFWCVVSRKQVAEVWNGIQDFDEILHELGYVRKERNAQIWVWSSLAVATFIYTLISQTGILAFYQPWTENVSYMIIYVGSAASVIKFSGLAMLVAQRFNYLNEISLECISRQSRRIIGTPTIDVNNIEVLHHHMLKVARKLNSAYSWSLMLWLMNLFLHSVSNVYVVSGWIIQTTFYLGVMSCIFCWIASFLIQLFILNYACDCVSSKANCFYWIVLEWKRQLIMHDSRMEIQISCTPIIHQFYFSAAGCFNINLQLLSSVASSLTTYLFILLQFE